MRMIDFSELRIGAATWILLAACSLAAVPAIAADISPEMLTAAKDGKLNDIKMLIANGEDVNATSAEGVTALMVAAAENQVIVVKALIQAGGDARAQTKSGKTALFFANAKGNTEVANLLQEAATNPQHPKPAEPAATSHNPTAAPLNPNSLHAKAPETFKAQFTTTKGDFVIEVHRDWAPLGADRFYNLIMQGYFTDVAFFRAIPNFMAQFGISGNPKIAATWEHASFKDDPVKESNKRGTITFATAGPNTRTTQFFINLKDNAFLNRQGNTPFGEVIENGMDVVDRIYTGYGDGPDQSRLAKEGKPYLDKNFPQLDSIKSAKVL